jgi:poly-gamma-glutamate capsule biosynthesis protein CapA/YwtB (metallophosphatase superfamily)
MRKTLIASIVLVIAAVTATALFGVGRAPASRDVAGEARLLFVGDLMMGRYVGASMARHGYDAPFGEVRGMVSAADVAVGNLEGPLVPAGVFAIPEPAPDLLTLTGDARSALALAWAGFDVLSVANNHSLDAGPEGLQATAGALEGAGIDPVGLDGAGGQEPVVREVRGLRIAFLAYSLIPANGVKSPKSKVQSSTETLDFGLWTFDLENEIARARKSADVVAVVMHWGVEYDSRPDETQRRLARAAAEAGADLVVGAHPHVASGLEQIGAPGRTTLVAYSLGNALFDQGGRPETRQGLALECTVDKDGVKSARLVPLETAVGERGYYILPADDASGQQVLRRAASSTPADLQWQSIWDVAQAEPGLALAYRRGVAGDQSADVDLGIPGGPSRVELRDGMLSVGGQDSAGGRREVWKSDPGWRVTHYAVGDANADGRPDLAYALWKRRLTWQRPEGGGMSVDPQGGEVLPHIYINGWRGDALEPVWHGSPRPAPALALAIAPVGVDGKPLLAVLESGDPREEKAPGTIRIWEWTGRFGYELAAAVPGAYSDMWTDGKVLMFR